MVQASDATVFDYNGGFYVNSNAMPSAAPTTPKPTTPQPSSAPNPAPTHSPTSSMPTLSPTMTPLPTSHPTFVCPVGYMQGRDRGLWNCTACDNSKPAFEFQSKIGAPNCVTARCHKRGTKRVDQVTGECECENFFEEKNCDTKQDVSTSMGLSYFITFLNICVCIWFLCFRGLQRVTDNMFTDSGDPPSLIATGV